ncbi:hypothetical protein [Nocardioides sp. Root140]|uniref:hypothetical protein n=1 Tax=Nocardioides sp. Root140 TaxID=1736460 RepID=UPI0006F96FC8|nr:hypothetical protein [Nocardioides sp. Root140]KQY57557.1 hypothetical protein ASD30_15385 [Nocardioides sp. Root140]
MSDADEPRPEYVSYEDFGRQFFVAAVTADRILAGVDVLAGEPIEFGPIGVGPGRLAKVEAKGRIGRPTASPRPGELVGYRVDLPVDLHLTIDLQLDTHRFDAHLVVPLELTARALDGCTIFIEAVPPRAEQVELELKAGGLRASLLQRVAGVEGEIQRFVAKYVARELDKPALRAARTIDVARAIDSSWSGPSAQ